jgi:hypothetical protein
MLKCRISGLDLFTHDILRDIVRNSPNEVTSTYTVEDTYGEKKVWREKSPVHWPGPEDD